MDNDLEHQPRLQTNHPTVHPRIPGLYRDSSGKLWSIYLDEAYDQDEEMTEYWLGEADSILVFTGLFSSVIATFLALSYFELFPGTADTTNALLTQISLQLVNISNGVPSQIGTTTGKPFTPSASAIRVNVIWYLSLVLSLSSALNATLFQQWSRRYREITRRRVAPHKRARTRAYMFRGIASFKMSRAVKAMPIQLHLSIFLFFAGLIDFLWNAYSTVGHWVLGFTSVLVSVYLTITVLPNLYLNCPYSTPASEFSWRLSQRLILFILHLIHDLQALSLQYRTQQQSRWSLWRELVKAKIKERRKWLEDGLQKSIMLNAVNAPSATDEDALSWTLTVLDDDRAFEDFVARVPGFFQSASVQDAPSIMLSLMDDQPDPSQSDQYDPILASSINDLLNTCISGTSPLREELRRNRLRICMKALWCFAKQYNEPEYTTPLPSYVRKTFANSDMAHRIRSEEDLAAHMIGLCFGSLVVKKLAQDIGSRIPQGPLTSETELSFLAAFLGKTTLEVAAFPSLVAIGLANIVSLTSTEKITLAEGKVPAEVLDIFRTTLNILVTETLAALPNAELPPDLITIFHETYSKTKAQRPQAPDWLIDQLGMISMVLSVELEVPRLALPETEPGPGLSTNASNISLPLYEGVLHSPYSVP